MEPFGVRVVVDHAATAVALAAIATGISLGTVSGLTPGVHANNFALLLAAVAPSVPAPPRLLGAAILAAGVVHTFLDVVPALALGVPDPAMAASALPGHKLVLEGRGREALRLSAIGSGGAVALAIPLAIPITVGMEAVYPALRPQLPVVLAIVATILVVTERTPRARIGGVLAFGASAALGFLTLDLPTAGVFPGGSMLAPLFAGLFGAPVLIDALDSGGVPPQGDAAVTLDRFGIGQFTAVGSLSGAIVGYIPGVSSAIAATMALLAVPHRSGARAFVVTTSGVNTANAIFALFALVALGTPRTGILVAVDDLGAPLALPLWLVSVAIAAAVGFVLVLTLGDRYFRVVERVDNVRLSVFVLGLLVVIAAVFAGPVGVLVFAAATVVGLVPARFGTRRATLMGVLIGPLIVSL
jgi:putative membrane protein